MFLLSSFNPKILHITLAYNHNLILSTRWCQIFSPLIYLESVDKQLKVLLEYRVNKTKVSTNDKIELNPYCTFILRRNIFNL